ncbi:beta-lactamase family protein [Arenibacter sp. BSSL-BM3]|uniref:Beta-lactamase family protein n=1 Tax=Arenibacter arenosicollis TaxID=2762274 RepID=A0ABR7QQ87_9FLAO|nr:serine hydrolase domain-containing protein [Arenibacter arenosicollis]MBC8769346.1 beta-lactamase family protein [Arenibacter arenosicollis]
MKSKILISILISGFSIGTAYSQNLNKPKLDSLFDILKSKDKAMGSLTISKNGTQLYSRAIGFSSISKTDTVLATLNTKYRIGSISKMFTATMIFQLIEEGKLNLNTTLDDFFPNLPNANKITISNLLNHRSGLYNFTNDPDYLAWMTQPKTKDEMLSLISKYKVDFKPNKKASYSNSNYVVLGYVIEHITNQSYSSNLGERITSKIGLSNTYVGNKTNINHNESYSYQFINNWEQELETDMSIPGGAGSILSTPSDLNRFSEALFTLRLISENSLSKMTTMTDGYGMGMFQTPFYSKKAFGHSGGIDGFASNLAYFPKDSLTIAYCTNGQVYPFNDILIGVLSICFNKEYSFPTFNTITLKTEDLDKYLGVYSSKKMRLKITITKDNTSLIAQGSGQLSFPLEATEENKFKSDKVGAKMEFNPEKNELILEQAGGRFLFKKDN